MFAMLGATILVPILAGMSISIALLAAGIGTIIFYFLTKKKVPVFLGSSFAFLPGLCAIVVGDIGSSEWNQSMACVMIALVCAGLVYVILSVVIKSVGVEKIKKLFPPIVVGPVVILVGMILAPKMFWNNIFGNYLEIGFYGGMKQRVLLAQALLGNPKILILDEPTAGLDPKERIGIRNYIAELSKDKIILFATHVVSDIECIADHVLLIKKGQIVATGTPVELIEKMQGKVAEITCTLDDVGALQAEYKVGNIRQRKNGLALRLVGDTLPKEAVPVEDNIDLEDVYLYYFE